MAKRKHKKKIWSVRFGDAPTMERCQQQGGVSREAVDRDASGNVLVWRSRAKLECMLDAYLIKGLIEKDAHEAGMRFRTAWLREVEKIKVDDRFSSGHAMTMEDWLNAVSQNSKYINEALAVLSPAQKKIIQRVCVDDKRAGGTDALETLRRGLDGLAKMWGMA